MLKNRDYEIITNGSLDGLGGGLGGGGGVKLGQLPVEFGLLSWPA